MKFIKSPRYWLIAFLLMTFTSIAGSIYQPSWVEKALISQPHSFKMLVGFYWGGRSTDLSETKTTEFSYLLFPGAKTISVEKMIYNGDESIKVDDSQVSIYIGILGYLISMVISLKYLIERYKKNYLS